MNKVIVPRPNASGAEPPLSMSQLFQSSISTMPGPYIDVGYGFGSDMDSFSEIEDIPGPNINRQPKYSFASHISIDSQLYISGCSDCEHEMTNIFDKQNRYDINSQSSMGQNLQLQSQHMDEQSRLIKNDGNIYFSMQKDYLAKRELFRLSTICSMGNASYHSMETSDITGLRRKQSIPNIDSYIIINNNNEMNNGIIPNNIKNGNISDTGKHIHIYMPSKDISEFTNEITFDNIQNELESNNSNKSSNDKSSNNNNNNNNNSNSKNVENSGLPLDKINTDNTNSTTNEELIEALPYILSKFDVLFPFYRLSDKHCKQLSLFVLNEINSIDKIFCNAKGRYLEAIIYYNDSLMPKKVSFYNKDDSDSEISQWKDIKMTSKYCQKHISKQKGYV